MHRDETLVLTLYSVSTLDTHREITLYIAGSAASDDKLRIGAFASLDIEMAGSQVGRLLRFAILDKSAEKNATFSNPARNDNRTNRSW